MRISGGLSLLDAKIEADPAGQFNGVPLHGNEIVMDISLKGMIRDDIPLADDSSIWFQRTLLTRARSISALAILKPRRWMGTGIINAHIGGDSASGETKVNAFMKNLTNKEYFVHGKDSGGPTQVRMIWGREQTWGVQLSRSF